MNVQSWTFTGWTCCLGAGHFGAAVLAPPFGRHRLGAHHFGAGTSRRWDISAPAVTASDVSAPDVSALALYAAAAAAATLHSNTKGTLRQVHREISTFLFADVGA